MNGLVLAFAIAALPIEPLLPGKPAVVRGHTDAITALAFSPDGKRLATGSRDKSVKLWDLESGASVVTIGDAKQHPATLAFSPDGTLLAIGDAELELRLVEVASGKVLRSWLHPDQLSEIVFDADGGRLAVAGLNGNSAVYSTKDGKKLFDVRANALCFLDGKEGLVLTGDGQLAPVDLKTGKLKKALATGLPAKQLVFTRDGSTVIGFNHSSPDLQLLDRKTGKPGAELKAPRPDPNTMPEKRTPPVVSSVALSVAGDRVAVSSVDHVVRVWKVKEGAVTQTIPTQHQAMVALSPDGKWVAATDLSVVALYAITP